MIRQTSFDPYRRRGLALIVIMSLIAATVGFVSHHLLYKTAVEQQRERLVETVTSWAQLIAAVARFDKSYSQDDFPGGAMAATLHQVRQAYSKFGGFGETGEFTLAKLSGDQIIFLLKHRHMAEKPPEPVTLNSRLAAPMQAALSGKSGTIIGPDYRGVTVLAAYHPITELGIGVVAKIDMREVRQPFIKAGLLTTLVGILLVLVGTLVFMRIGSPLLRKLRENEVKYRGVFQQAPEGILLLDSHSCRILEFNDMACRMLGFSREEFSSLSSERLGELQGLQEMLANIPQIEKEGQIGFESQQPVLDGRTRHLRINAQWLRIGLSARILAIISDISEHKRMEQRLHELAIHDSLTGLLNRGEIERILAEEVGRAKRYRRELSIFIVDIDHFKRVNDTWGHLVGDLALERFAQSLQRVIRHSDRAGRYGGEEFLVMLPETGLQQAASMAKRLQEDLKTNPVEIGAGDRLNLTVSIGVACFPLNGKNRDQIIGRADQALYLAKAEGRDTIICASA